MKKTIYYSDPLHDDFALTHGRIRKKVIDAEYHYTHRSPVWHFASFVLYRLIVTPLAELLMHVPTVAFVVTYRQRRILRKLPPRITVTVSDPIAPESVASKKALRDCVYDFMCRAVAAQGS